MAFDERTLYEIARHYHKLGKTQSEIADSLGISRSQVSRALKQAQDEGIVVIHVIPPEFDLPTSKRNYALYSALTMQWSS